MNLNTIVTAYRELQDDGLIRIRPGSGAVVTSSRAADRDAEELRRPLRAALTEFLLAGLPERQILRLVSKELRALSKGAS